MDRFPADEREREAAWLRALGLRVPERFFADPFVQPTAWFAHPASSVDPHALADDLPLLRETLRDAYAGWETASEADWGTLFTAWERHLRGTPAPRDAFAPWTAWQGRCPDRHTGPWPGSPTPQPFTGVVQGALEGAEAWRDASGVEHALDHGVRVHAAYAESRRVGVVRALAEAPAPAAVRSAGAWHVVRPLLPLPTPPLADEPATGALAPDVGSIRIPTATPAHVAPRLPSSQWRLVVCDLRGNRGGGLGPWLDYLCAWLGASVLDPWRQVGGWDVRSPRTPALHWGVAQAAVVGHHSPLEEPLRTQAQAVLDGLGSCPRREVVRRSGHWRWPVSPRPAPTDEPRLIVLVDDRCGSDGELLAMLLAVRPGARLVGRGTAGACGWVRPGRLVLPRSRVGFQLATGRLDPLGPDRPVDGLGLPVDVLVEAWPADDAGLLALARAADGCP
ncbi:MAG: S41 family peptidase [Vicinamibacteria bacterium]|nr:S41 family peptidase [Vicinamibacteria bacterium]